MKTVAIFVSLVAVALAAPQQSVSVQPQVYIVNEIPSDNIGSDSYRFAYELSDGQKREEFAQFEPGRIAEDGILRVSGSFSWINPEDGQTYTIVYIADENGFQPQGAHIPVV